MKRDYLTELLSSGKEQKDIIDEIMNLNGNDIETAKASVKVDTSKYVAIEEHNALLTKHSALENDFNTYKESTKDYEEVKGNYQSLLKAQEDGKKINYLKGLNCKHPDLLVDKFDWSKCDLEKNETDKDYLESFKGQYNDLFVVEDRNYNPQTKTPLKGNYNPRTNKEWTNEELRKL